MKEKLKKLIKELEKDVRCEDREKTSFQSKLKEAIKKVLHNSGYDVEFEIMLYRNSKLYQSIKEYNQE